MRYYYEKPHNYVPLYGEVYECDHPLYKQCTLFRIGERGLAVVQQRFHPQAKVFYLDSIDPWLANDIYLADGFLQYHRTHAAYTDENGLYPTVGLRKIMWALRMKPLEKEFWEHGI